MSYAETDNVTLINNTQLDWPGAISTCTSSGQCTTQYYFNNPPGSIDFKVNLQSGDNLYVTDNISKDLAWNVSSGTPCTLTLSETNNLISAQAGDNCTIMQ